MPAKPLTKNQLKESARLKTLFKEWQARQRDDGRKVSQDDVAEKLGIGQSAFSQYLNGKIPLNPEFAVKIATLLQCQVSDFSDMVSAQIGALTLAIPMHGLTVIAGEPDDVEIPQFRAGGSMGPGRLLLDGQPGVIKNWHVDQEWIRRNVPNHTGIHNLCIVTGFGNSMLPMFNPGDPLLVDRGVTMADHDAVFFFRVNNHGYIKMLQRIPKGDATILRAKSKNPDYDSFDIDASMDFQVLGKVLTIWRSEHF